MYFKKYNFDKNTYTVVLSCEEVGVTVIGVWSIEPGGRVRFSLFFDIVDILLRLKYHISIMEEWIN